MQNSNEIIYDQAFDVENLQKRVDLKWQELQESAIKNNLTLYNGESYRFESLTKDENVYNLKLSKINFKERICLEKLAKNQENSIFSKGLAIGGFLQTSDGFFYFWKNERQNNV